MSENSSREAELRNQIRELTKEYYQIVHRPKQHAEFIPGQTNLSYAGRVFDEHEMLNLIDSSLEFWLTSGRFTEQFESRFAATLGVKYALLVNSGSSANLVAFNALTSPLLKDRRIQKGDEVMTVAAGFPTTVAPIIQFGAIPVFVDITVEDGTYNIDVTQLEAALSPRTKAVMVAHTLGNPFRLEEVSQFCKQHGLWLVEDNCDALGSLYRGKMTGTFGDIATSSFYPPHHLTMGEGGAVYTSNPFLKRAAESIRDWGRDCWCPSGKDNTCKKRFDWQLGELPKGYDHKYIYSHLGYNLKATDLQASIGLAQLDKLSKFTAARRRNFTYLRDALGDLQSHLILPQPTPHAEPSWFGFLMTVKPGAGFERTALTKFLESRKIQTRMLFAGNLLRHPAFDSIRNTSAYRVIGELANTDRVMADTFWIGVYPGLTEPMLKYMSDQIHMFVKERPTG